LLEKELKYSFETLGARLRASRFAAVGGLVSLVSTIFDSPLVRHSKVITLSASLPGQVRRATLMKAAKLLGGEVHRPTLRIARRMDCGDAQVDEFYSENMMVFTALG